jgi:O-antigen ligase
MWLLVVSIGLLLWTALAAGGVVHEQFAIASGAFGVLALVEIARWKLTTSRRRYAPPLAITIPALILLGYMALQVLPLPESMVASAWPGRVPTLTLLSDAGLSQQGAWSTVSLRPSATVQRAALFLTAICVAIIAYGLSLRSRLSLQSVLVPIAIVGAVEACLALLVAARGDGTSVVAGTFVNRNHFASLMSISLPVTLAFGLRSGVEALRDESRSMRNAFASVSWLGCAALQLFACVLSMSRGGFIASIIGLTLLSAAVMTSLPGRKRRMALLVGLMLAVVLLGTIATSGVAARLSQVEPADQLSTEMRLQIWGQALVAFGDHWILGSGAGAFEDAFVALNNFAPGMRVDFAHSDYLQVLVELGILGAIPALFLAYAILVRLARVVLNGGGGDRIYLTAAAASLFAFALHETVEFNLAIPILSLLVAWLIGVICAHGELRAQPGDSGRHAIASLELRGTEVYSMPAGVASLSPLRYSQ